MDIKELESLIREHGSNEHEMRQQVAFKERVVNKWAKDSQGIIKINRIIKDCMQKNDDIEKKIKEVANITFNWR